MVNKNLKSVDFNEAVESNGHHITASAEKNTNFFIFLSSQDWKSPSFFVFIQLVRFQEFAKFELQPHSSIIIITVSTSGFQTLFTCAYFFKMVFPLCAVLFAA